MTWYASVAVWGDYHRRLFLEGSLPSLFAPGNLDALDGVRYVIHTDEPDKLTGHPSFARLRELTEVVMVRPVIGHGNEWERSAAANREVLAEANGAPVLFLNADTWLSEGAMVHAKRHIDEGKRLIAVCGLRADEDAPYPPSTRSRDLIAWFLEHPHECMVKSIWGTERATMVPSITFFPAPCGLIAHAFHLHPLVVRAEPATEFRGTIDDDLVAKLNPEDVKVITDSDEIAIAEISPRTRTLGDFSEPISPALLCAFATYRANPMHWRFFQHRIALRAWDGATTAADGPVVAETLRLRGNMAA